MHAGRQTDGQKDWQTARQAGIHVCMHPSLSHHLNMLRIHHQKELQTRYSNCNDRPDNHRERHVSRSWSFICTIEKRPSLLNSLGLQQRREKWQNQKVWSRISTQWRLKFTLLVNEHFGHRGEGEERGLWSISRTFLKNLTIMEVVPMSPISKLLHWKTNCPRSAVQCKCSSQQDQQTYTFRHCVYSSHWLGHLSAWAV